MPLVCSSISVRLHPALPPAVENVSLRLVRGEQVALVGPNGSGKSTLVRMLAGLITPDSGRIDGLRGCRIGLVQQDPASQLIAGTVAEDIAFGPSCHGLAAAHVEAVTVTVLRRFGLADLACRAPHDLSGGQQQRVATAGMFALDDLDLLLLDEPSAHLDLHARRDLELIVRSLGAAGPAVVWVTQLADEIAAMSRTVVMVDGSIAFDGPSETWLRDAQAATSIGLDIAETVRLAQALRSGGMSGTEALPLDEAALIAALGASHGR